jgi:two-component system cell cycle sensor histidine kinase/response regulator CckA
MSEYRKEFEPEKYKKKRLHTAPANPAPEPASTPENQEKNNRPVSVPGSEKTEELAELKEKYRNILEGIEEGYFEVDLKGNLTFFNDAMCSIFGYTPDELKTRNYREYTAPGTAKKISRIFANLYETGRPARVLNYEIITKDGTKKILYLSASLMRDADRKTIGFRGIVQDVTDQLIAEKQREHLANQMLHAQKMEAIGTLAGGIAHDFNNLLMGFQGNLSLMLLDVDLKHPHHEYLMNMEEYVKRGSELTRQILGFARGGKYEVKPTDLNELLEKSSEMFRRTKKEIAIHKKFQKDLWSVEVDRGQIEQVMLNLFVNAWQAMPSGGKLFLETENLVLKNDDLRTHYALDAGKYVRISVTDTGTGMDKPTRERIFEPFFTTKEVGSGTGLGLASAYGIIKNHNGNIEVESQLDHGTTFKLYLPISNKEVLNEGIANGQTYKGRETILLIDDEEMIANTGKKLLEKLGYRVFLAESGQSALKIYERYRDRIGLIILDMIMPGMSGSEVFDHLKATDPSVRVLLSSGYSLSGQASQIMERGCNGFIQKPFNIEQISKKIREILDNAP